MLRITDPSFVYVPAAQTDIRRTFRKHGFVGPEEKRHAGVVAPVPVSSSAMATIEKIVAGYEVVTILPQAVERCSEPGLTNIPFGCVRG